MTIEFDCTGCKTRLHLPDEMAGTRAKCVRCGTILTIPSPSDAFWPPGARPASNAPQQSADAAGRSRSGHGESWVFASPPNSSVSDTRIAPLTATQTVVVPRAEPGGTSDGHAADRSQAEASHSGSHAPPIRASRPILIPETVDDSPADDRPHTSARLEIGDVMRRAWGIYKTNFRMLVVAGVVLCVVAGAASFALVWGLRRVGAPGAIQSFVPQAVLLWLMLGAMEFTIKTARGRARLADLFGGMPLFVPGLTVWAICFLPLLLAALVCSLAGVPAMIVAAVFSLLWMFVSFMIHLPSLLVLVDREPKPIEALFKAVRYARRNCAALTGVFVISICVLAASCIPLGLGLPVGIPFVLLVSSVAYLRDRSARE
jgi:hypothetical protein